MLFLDRSEFRNGTSDIDYQLRSLMAQHLEVSAVHEQLDDTKSTNKFEASFVRSLIRRLTNSIAQA